MQYAIYFFSVYFQIFQSERIVFEIFQIGEHILKKLCTCSLFFALLRPLDNLSTSALTASTISLSRSKQSFVHARFSSRSASFGSSRLSRANPKRNKKKIFCSKNIILKNKKDTFSRICFCLRIPFANFELFHLRFYYFSGL